MTAIKCPTRGDCTHGTKCLVNGSCIDPTDTNKCAVCSERIRREGHGWTHLHTDMYCGTGDGAMAQPVVP